MKKIKRVFSLIIAFIMGLSVKLYAVSTEIRYVPLYGVANPEPRYGSVCKYEILSLILKIFGLALIPLIFLEGYKLYKKDKSKEKGTMHLVFTVLLACALIVISIVLNAYSEWVDLLTLWDYLKNLIANVGVTIIAGFLTLFVYIVYIKRNKADIRKFLENNDVVDIIIYTIGVILISAALIFVAVLIINEVNDYIMLEA